MPARLRRLGTDELSHSERGELRALFDEAWHGDDGFDDDDWAHALGGTHFLMEADGTVRSHVSVVPRTLVTGGRALRTGYVEAVATREHDRRRGYASELMRVATDFVDERYELGALGTELFDFYASFGWERWRGPTSVRTGNGEIATPQEDGFVMIHRTPTTPGDLDLDAPMTPDTDAAASSPSNDDQSEAFRDLSREMYWARESAARARMDTPEIRDRLHDFAAQMRTDETVVIPMGEGNLASPSTWRRQLKRRIWRVMRPATWRYDRLLGDHAELTTSLAEKVMVLEAEVDRLKAERDDDAARGENAP